LIQLSSVDDVREVLNKCVKLGKTGDLDEDKIDIVQGLNFMCQMKNGPGALDLVDEADER